MSQLKGDFQLRQEGDVTGLEDFKSSCKIGNRPKGVSCIRWMDKR